jgi:hypothetical protein
MSKRRNYERANTQRRTWGNFTPEGEMRSTPVRRPERQTHTLRRPGAKKNALSGLGSGSG